MYLCSYYIINKANWLRTQTPFFSFLFTKLTPIGDFFYHSVSAYQRSPIHLQYLLFSEMLHFRQKDQIKHMIVFRELFQLFNILLSAWNYVIPIYLYICEKHNYEVVPRHLLERRYHLFAISARVLYEYQQTTTTSLFLLLYMMSGSCWCGVGVSLEGGLLLRCALH